MYTQQWEEDRRVEELDSDEDDGQGVGLDGAFTGNGFDFTSADLGRRSHRRKEFDNSILSSSSEESELSEDSVGRTMQLALRDKEELLVQKALQRIRRAQILGKTNVKLTQPELDALQRKRRRNQTSDRQIIGKSSSSKLKDTDRWRGSGKSSGSSKDGRLGKRDSKGYFSGYDGESSSGSRNATPPGILVPGANTVPASLPQGYRAPSVIPQGRSLGAASHSASSSGLARDSPPVPRLGKQRYSSGPESSQASQKPRSPLSSRRLPDDPNWTPRSRSSSAFTTQSYPADSHYYSAYSPVMPQVPARYSQGRRIMSSSQSDLHYSRYSGDQQARSSEPSLPPREQSRLVPPDLSVSDDETDSDDGDDGVSVNVVPYGPDFGVNVRSQNSVKERQRRGQR